MQDMDDMDIDAVDEATAAAVNPRTGFRRKKHTHRHQRDSGPRTSGSSSTAVDDREQQVRRARLVQLINSTLEDSSKAQDEVVELDRSEVTNGSALEKNSKEHLHVPHRFQHKGSWRKKEKEELHIFDGGDLREGVGLRTGQARDDASWRNHGQRRAVNNGLVAPRNSVKDQASIEVDGWGVGDVVERVTCSSNMKKETDSSFASQHRTRQGHGKWPQSASGPNNGGRRRLVQGADTSHYTEGWGKNTKKGYGIGAIMHSEPIEGSSSHPIACPDSEGIHPDKKNGKIIMEDSILRGGRDSKVGLHSEGSVFSFMLIVF